MKLDQIRFQKIRLFYEAGFSAPLVLKKNASLAPWELYQRIYSRSERSFFLDSLHSLLPTERYSYMGWRPYLGVFFKEGRLWTEGAVRQTKERPDLLKELRRFFSSVRVPPEFSFECFAGGAVGYFGYELAQEFDRISLRPKKGLRVPSLALLFFRDLIVFDHKRGDYYLISWALR